MVILKTYNGTGPQWSLCCILIQGGKKMNEKESIEEMAKEMEEYAEKRRIKFPITVENIVMDGSCHREKSFTGPCMGDWVSVMPCGEEYGRKTYLGIMLGELPIWIHVSLSPDSILKLSPHLNPAMYVPDLKQIIYGCGSFWRKIESPDDLSRITDADIENVWYMRALKELGANETEANDD